MISQNWALNGEKPTQWMKINPHCEFCCEVTDPWGAEKILKASREEDGGGAPWLHTASLHWLSPCWGLDSSREWLQGCYSALSRGSFPLSRVLFVCFPCLTACFPLPAFFSFFTGMHPDGAPRRQVLSSLNPFERKVSVRGNVIFKHGSPRLPLTRGSSHWASVGLAFFLSQIIPSTPSPIGSHLKNPIRNILSQEDSKLVQCVNPTEPWRLCSTLYLYNREEKELAGPERPSSSLHQ